jgi:hypothetical protein
MSEKRYPTNRLGDPEKVSREGPSHVVIVPMWIEAENVDLHDDFPAEGEHPY